LQAAKLWHWLSYMLISSIQVLVFIELYCQLHRWIVYRYWRAVYTIHQQPCVSQDICSFVFILVYIIWYRLPLVDVWATMNVGRINGKITGTVLCWTDITEPTCKEALTINILSSCSHLVDEERMRPVGDWPWWGSRLWVSFSNLMLLVRWQEEHPACKNSLCHLSQRLSSGTGEGKGAIS